MSNESKPITATNLWANVLAQVADAEVALEDERVTQMKLAELLGDLSWVVTEFHDWQVSHAGEDSPNQWVDGNFDNEELPPF